jgi:CRP/FNR family transcriptional regulator, nitrogen oxide reductase regulator
VTSRRSPVEPIELAQELHCSVDEQRRLLGASPFFARLEPDQVFALQLSFRQQHYAEGERIQIAGNPADRLNIVAAGMVKMARPTPDGQDVLLDFLGPGEHFGSLTDLGDSSYQEDVTAHTACCILYTTAETFRNILKAYPVVAISSLEMVARRLRNAQSTIEQLSAYPVEHRVASTLLHLAEKRGKEQDRGTLIEMPLSRQDIADMTGAKVETVSRVMSEFRRSGLIDSGRRWISVLDTGGLSDIADGIR